MFRKLYASEIDVRVQSVKKTGAVLLLYKDARVDQDILDETVGNMFWQREHSRDNANCKVGIWSKELNQWVWKEDTGTESNTEKAKGLASDSFKRACFNWGIGRELYTSPFIWVAASDIKIDEKNGKYSTYDKFEVSNITYSDNGDIHELTIINAKTKKVVWTNAKGAFEPKPKEKPKQQAKQSLHADKVKALEKSIVDAKKSPQDITKAYKVSNLSELTLEQWTGAMKRLQEIIDKGNEDAK